MTPEELAAIEAAQEALHDLIDHPQQMSAAA